LEDERFSPEGGLDEAGEGVLEEEAMGARIDFDGCAIERVDSIPGRYSSG
jgi:hypothetical protein